MIPQSASNKNCDKTGTWARSPPQATAARPYAPGDGGSTSVSSVQEGRVMTEKAARACTEKEVCLTGALLFTTFLCIDPTNNSPFAQSIFNILNFKLSVEGSTQPLPL
jgi:hypothetical protein